MLFHYIIDMFYSKYSQFQISYKTMAFRVMVTNYFSFCKRFLFVHTDVTQVLLHKLVIIEADLDNKKD